MERLAEQPQTHETQKKTFDALASVDMARYDLDNFGVVLPETRQRIYDEEMSYVVEGMEEEACTEFVLRRNDDGQLVYFNRGKWRPYMDMLDEAIEVHRAEAAEDPKKSFLVDNALTDRKYGLAMQELKPGERLCWHSAYCDEQEDKYGAEFVDSIGYNSSRRMGFLYEATCLEDGSVRLYSQTVDNSDADAFEAAMTATGGKRAMLAAYDTVLMQKFGKKFQAGREYTEMPPSEEDAWQKLRKETNLIDHYLNKIQWLHSRQ